MLIFDYSSLPTLTYRSRTKYMFPSALSIHGSARACEWEEMQLGSSGAPEERRLLPSRQVWKEFHAVMFAPQPHLPKRKPSPVLWIQESSSSAKTSGRDTCSLSAWHYVIMCVSLTSFDNGPWPKITWLCRTYNHLDNEDSSSNKRP